MVQVEHLRRDSSSKKYPLLAVLALLVVATVVMVQMQDDSRPIVRNLSPNLSEMEQQGSTAGAIDLGRKNGTPIILNIGSNVDPIVPRSTDDPCTVALAFEPVVSHLIPPHPALHVIPAAVTGEGGWASMFMYNTKGVSSSLSKPKEKAVWNKGGGTVKIVPTISFQTILESLRHYKIDLIMTDMQGHDFAAVSSVGGLLKGLGVKRLVTEVYKDNIATYQGVKNDLCQDWLPHMTSIGYIFEGLTEMRVNEEKILEGFRSAEEIQISCKKTLEGRNVEAPKAEFFEYNAFWRLEGEEPSSDLKVYHYGKHSPRKTGHTFTDEEYQKCS
jgi:hypothetical protein